MEKIWILRHKNTANIKRNLAYEYKITFSDKNRCYAGLWFYTKKCALKYIIENSLIHLEPIGLELPKSKFDARIRTKNK